MTSKTEAERILAGQSSSDERIITFGALLSRETGADVIVVGGSAIEVYTRGGYASADIDLVGDRRAIIKAVESWDFRPVGHMWVNRNWGIAADPRGEDYTGDLGRTREVVTPFGRVRLAAVEDLIVKRLASVKHWNQRGAIKEAGLLLASRADEIDWAYLEGQAEDYHVVDVLHDLMRSLKVKRR